MNFNYTLTYTKIKSNWLRTYSGSNRNKKNIYSRIGKYRGLYLYFKLYKFRIHNQENFDTFITSIALLRKETGYSTEDIFELLKKMKRANVINIRNISRWDYLMDNKNNIRDKDTLIIVATDVPRTIRVEKRNADGNVVTDSEGNVIEIDQPLTENDRYIGISFEVFKKYDELGLNDKFFALYCLLNKWNNNPEKKSFMSIEKMAKILEIDKDFLHQMIYKMNENYLLFSSRRSRSQGGYYFEHYLATSEKIIEEIERHYSNEIKKMLKRLKKRREKNQALNIEDELPITKVEKFKTINDELLLDLLEETDDFIEVEEVLV